MRIIDMAEVRSRGCESCGKPVPVRQSIWMLFMLCDACLEAAHGVAPEEAMHGPQELRDDEKEAMRNPLLKAPDGTHGHDSESGVE